ncbi:nucleoside/nucleotide kinase family protein [Pectobacterium punjabense]|uniref:hypothetical protein n=1 Tax=Pectobacterium punjabense TaxID=2108399 RepID=UPI002406146C|nr:hypothetical protein [Pectobacterium punjabense]MDG0796064.1 hypothetical protein [Pectobacterium punjabense]
MLINLLGCDGAGKSTQMSKLLPWLEQRTGKKVTTLTKRDALRRDAYPEARYITSDYRTLMYDILPEMHAESRAFFIFNLFAIQICRHPPQQGTLLFLDGGWQKHVASEAALGLDETWLNQLVACFPLVDLTLFLDVRPETVLRWRQQNDDTHAPYECGNQSVCSDDAFLQHMRKVYQILKRQALQHNWLIIDGEREPQAVFTDLQSAIDNYFSHHQI